MIKILALVVFTGTFAACAPVSPRAAFKDADENYLLGTWVVVGGLEEEVFLSTHSYCSYSSSANPVVVSRGTWSVTQPGMADIDVESAIDPKLITPDDVSQLLIIKRIDPGKLLMGYLCPHCEGGIFGQVFARAEIQRSSCEEALINDVRIP